MIIPPLLLMMWALVAFALHVWAAVFTHGWLRWLFIIGATLALTYTGGYLYLFVTGDLAGYSSALTPLGVVAWPVSWWAPPIIVIRYMRKQAAAIQQKTKEILGIEY